MPARTLKLQADYRVAALPGLSLQAGLSPRATAWCCPTTVRASPA